LTGKSQASQIFSFTALIGVRAAAPRLFGTQIPTRRGGVRLDVSAYLAGKNHFRFASYFLPPIY